MIAASDKQKGQVFVAKLKGLIEQAGYRNPVTILQWNLKGSSIEGIFADQSGRKIFDFSVGADGVAYQPLPKFRQDGMQVILQGIRQRAVSSAYLSGARRDAKSKYECSSPTSYSCGNGCINNNKQCRIKDQRVKQASTALLQEARTLKLVGNTMGISPQQLEEKIQKAEEQIRTASVENAVIIDPSTGDTVFTKSGDSVSVDFTEAELAKMKGKIITHNHPNALGVPDSDPRAKGFSLSPDDIRLVCGVEGKEIRAVTAGYQFTMKPPPGGFNKDLWNKKVLPSLNKNSKGVYKQTLEEIQAKKITPEEDDANFNHRVWTKVSAETGMKYSRKELPYKKQRGISPLVLGMQFVGGAAYFWFAINGDIDRWVSQGIRAVKTKSGRGKYIEKSTLQPTAITKVDKSVRAEEEKIRNQAFETGVLVDSKTGEVIFRKDGQTDRVDFTADEIIQMEGQILTHNHPNVLNVSKDDPRYKGFSFSPADIELACNAKVAEIRAVANEYSYSLKPPEEGWSRMFHLLRVMPSFKRHETDVLKEVRGKIATGNMSVERAEVDYYHEIWTRVAKDTGMTYKRWLAP